MTPSRSIRPKGLLRWLVVALLVLTIVAAYWYYQQRKSLVCATEGEGSWSLTYADGDHISKFMWAIRPGDEDAFLSCLEGEGYELRRVPASGEITAQSSNGWTISNSIGDDYVQEHVFYRW